ncbi:MAG: MBL fold metallo-hydrolase [Syntrophales bacterium]
MQVTCLGAARTVTGSCFLLESNQTRILVDCGMFQGGKETKKRNASMKKYRPETLQHILVTHAHLDHSGLIPLVVKEGFKGSIICTKVTFELCKIMLLDSAHIQEMETEWQNRKNARSGKKPVEPLYTKEDAERSLSFFRPVDPGECYQVSPDIEICFHNAGHILGATYLEISFKEQGLESTVVFSGDIGRKGALLTGDPHIIKEADFLFIESTYGNRLHKSIDESKAEFLSVLREGIKSGEKIIIPAFAVERTQEILYILNEFRENGSISSIPVYLDSPLAIAATEIFKKYPEYFKLSVNHLIEEGDNPLDFPELIYTRTSEESMEINHRQGPAIIIAGSGMCNAGRIKHHLKHNLWRPGAHIVFMGFQAEGSLGRSIVNGAKKVRIFNEDVVVRAKVHTIGGFSAHADKKELLTWIGHFKNPKLEVFVVHGEESVCLDFAESVQNSLYLQVNVPQWLETVTLSPHKKTAVEPAPEVEDISHLFTSLEGQLRILRNYMEGTKDLEKEKVQHIKALIENTGKEMELLMKGNMDIKEG